MVIVFCFFFFKQKTAYEMRISDWSSDVCSSDLIACCEALIRWRHPVLGDISPGEFIPIAESISMIGPISEWVLAQACNAAAQWPGDVRVAVNISPALLRSADLPHTVISCLDRKSTRLNSSH